MDSSITMGKARRVRKEDVKVEKFARPDGLSMCLMLWKSLHDRDDTDLGIKSQSLLCGSGDGYGNEDTGQMRRENDIAKATDAMIRGLKSSHQWALRRQAGLCTTWRFPQLDYLVEAIDARIELEKKLRKNFTTGVFW